MFTISNGPAGIILVVTVLCMVVLSLQVDPTTKTARNVQNILWFGAINILAVAVMYLAWAWLPLDWAYEIRTWMKLVDGLAAFGCAGAMFMFHRSLKR